MLPRVLIIDDEQPWRDLFQDILTQMRWHVDTAEGIAEAEGLLARSTYDLIVLDVALDKPYFDLACQQFCHSLTQKYLGLPILAATGKLLDPTEMWTLFQSGIADFIYKPRIQLPYLQQQIQHIVHKSQSARASAPIEPDHERFPYDLFISYSHQDREWVERWLLSRLEGHGLRVCIDFRDFAPGAPALTEMERAVLESRKTVLVFTPAYLGSEWAEFENILAQSLDPAARKRRLLPLLLQPCTIPLRIRSLIYLDFSRTDQVDFELGKLIAALRG